MTKRTVTVERRSAETEISLTLALDGQGKTMIDTGIGFFDHMLTHIAFHGLFDLNLTVKGDLFVDSHHTVEDTGIVLGQAINQAVGDKKGIWRYGQAIVPMDESLAHCILDLSGRPFLVFDAAFTNQRLGMMDSELVEEFFRAVASQAKMTLHCRLLAGKNNHHMAEALFKAFGRALRQAVSYDEKRVGQPSTKGMFD